LSKLGLATRSEARDLIEAGRVTVNGATVRDPMLPVVPERVRVGIDGFERAVPEPITIVVHKPRGVVTTRRDPQRRRTVYDLIVDLDAHVIPVGRLDFATSGLLLMTNDTALADWLLDPVNAIPRVYLVTVRGRLTEEHVARLSAGLLVDGERLQARSAILRKTSARESHLIVELTEGRNREIRRMITALGSDVTRLRRVQFGGLTLEDLPAGQWRRLNEAELARAFPQAPRRIARRVQGT
jgi:23S rRNA pseudouridine2605 synthase